MSKKENIILYILFIIVLLIQTLSIFYKGFEVIIIQILVAILAIGLMIYFKYYNKKN